MIKGGDDGGERHTDLNKCQAHPLCSSGSRQGRGRQQLAAMSSGDCGQRGAGGEQAGLVRGEEGRVFGVEPDGGEKRDGHTQARWRHRRPDRDKRVAAGGEAAGVRFIEGGAFEAAQQLAGVVSVDVDEGVASVFDSDRRAKQPRGVGERGVGVGEARPDHGDERHQRRADGGDDASDR